MPSSNILILTLLVKYYVWVIQHGVGRKVSQIKKFNWKTKAPNPSQLLPACWWPAPGRFLAHITTSLLSMQKAHGEIYVF